MPASQFDQFLSGGETVEVSGKLAQNVTGLGAAGASSESQNLSVGLGQVIPIGGFRQTPIPLNSVGGGGGDSGGFKYINDSSYNYYRNYHNYKNYFVRNAITAYTAEYALIRSYVIKALNQELDTCP